MDIITTQDKGTYNPYLTSFRLPQPASHKGQNGKVLVIGGSSLFHGAVLWAAEAVSFMADMTHLASTVENNEIIRAIKIKWQSGIVIPQKDIPLYAEEDDVLLVGNGMMRGDKQGKGNVYAEHTSWENILAIHNEGEFTAMCVYYLITHFPHKQFVFDAGALQMMDKDWLLLLAQPAVLTPHQEEFFHLFGIDIKAVSLEEKAAIVEKTALHYHAIILLKAVDDIVSDGKKTVIIRGGNAGLTKGGTGDLLAGITTGFLTRTDGFTSSVLASLVLKKTADNLFALKGYWYSVHELLVAFPSVLAGLTKTQF